MRHWILFSEVRGGLQRWWNVVTLTILLVLIIQSASGKVAEIEFVVWLWAWIIVFPGSILLNAGIWLNRYPAKILSPNMLLSIRLLCIGYILLALLTLLFEEKVMGFYSVGNLSLEQYLYKSYGWLLPINVLLIFALYLLFFHKTAFSKVDSGMLKAIAEQKANISQTNGQGKKTQVLDMIIADELNGVFEQLKQYFTPLPNNDLLNEVLVLSHEYHQTQKALDMNLIEPSEASKVTNRITLALIHLTEQLP